MCLKFLSLCFIGAGVALAGCSQPAEQAAAPAAATAPAKPALGIKPFGTADPNFKPDYSKLAPELAKTFAYIDEHIDEHVVNLQKWIQQPSISNSGEGIPESAEMVKGFFEELGCQDARVFDPGPGDFGIGNPVVYAKCDEGAEKTLAIYWMYDNMPVTQPDNWIAPPFEARIVSGEQAVVPTASRVLIGRGANNSKGGHMAILNAVRSMKTVMGKLPVNLIFVAEGDEERMSIGLRKFFADHSDLMQEADALLSGGPSEGCVNVELVTSGKNWGRGPVQSDIHGSRMRTADSPAWRHIEMLASLVEDNGNTPLIKGFFENKELPTPADVARMKEEAAKMDLVTRAKNDGLARYKWDDPYMVIKAGSFETSFNMDGIFGGNMYAGGAGAILPNKLTSKHHFRYVPRMDGFDILKKLRAQIDANGYKDVEVKLIGDVPWSRGSSRDTDITHAREKGAEDLVAVGLADAPTPAASRMTAAVNSNGMASDLDTEQTAGFWPAYLWTEGESGGRIGTIAIPMGMGGAGGGIGGGGGRSHASNEFYIVEAIGKTAGLAYNEKSVAAAIFEYSKITTVPPKPKTRATK